MRTFIKALAAVATITAVTERVLPKRPGRVAPHLT